MKTELNVPRVTRVVALASRTGAYGGPFDTARQQARIGAEMGFSINLVAGHLASDEPDHPHDAIYDQTLARVASVPGTSGFSGLASLAMVRLLWSSTRQCEIVHISFSREFIPTISTLIALMLQKRIVLQPHGMLTARTSAKHKVADLITKSLYNRSHAVLALTEFEKLQLKKWAPKYSKNIYVHGNPIPEHKLGKVRQLNDDASVAFIARLHPRKRLTTYLAAAEEASVRGIKARFIVAGPDEGDLPMLTTRMKHLNTIEYRGAVPAPEVIEILDSSSIFVLTSRNEPWGNVLALALSMGIPVVVTASSALAPMIERYGAGRIVPDDNATALTDAFEEILSNPKVYEGMSANCLQLTKHNLGQSSQKKLLRALYSPENL